MLRLILSSVILISFLANAQNPEKEFEEFKRQQAQEFLNEVKKQDSIFAEQILKNWRDFTLNPALEKEYDKPKPTEQPDEIDTVRNLKYPIKDFKEKKLRSFTPEKYEHFERYPETRTISSGFHGKGYKIKVPSALVEFRKVETDKSFVAEYWREMSSRPYQQVINDLIDLKNELNIPGFGFYLLARDFSEEFNISPELRTFFTWFVLLKTGYEARIGFSQDKPVIILASKSRVYGIQYYNEGDRFYYVLGTHDGRLSSYGEVYSEGAEDVDFEMREPLDFPFDAGKRTVNFEYDGNPVSLDLHYDKNAIKFLERIPQTEMSVYLTAHGSFLLKRSLEKQIGEHISKMSEIEKMAFLLTFVQTAFGYQTDQQQFGKEKVMYPDQFLHFQNSDCDDRTVFLNYLLRLFTNRKAIAISFPQHIALAVDMPGQLQGEKIEYKGVQYVFFDPTYMKAPPGMVIPHADRSKIRVISY